MARFDYDLFVIGGGSGGVRAARIAAGHGARVACAEEYRFGGTCVIRGCVPKKLFVYASRFSEAFEDAANYGWTVPPARFDWPTLVANKDKEIDRLNAAYIANLEKAGVEIISRRAELSDRHTVRLVGEAKPVTAETILIATGARPFVPGGLTGAEHVITSNEVFHLAELPGGITVVGGGYIAVEFAGIFNGLGRKTTLLYRGEQILRGFDDDLRAMLAAEMTRKGIDVRTQTDVAGVERDGERYRVHTRSGGTVITDLVMYATGRRPNTHGLGLETAGVQLDGNGAVKVDGYSKSSVDNIYAVGDVTDRINLTPVAIREGHAFADTLFGGKPVQVDHANVASAVFSQPELGVVGLTEAQARATHANIVIYKTSFQPMKHTISGRDEQMLMKIVVNSDNDRVLGCHVMGDDAGEMAQLLAIPIKMGATKADFDATIAVHPTASEEWVTMRDPWLG